jgi:hypothetical protein
MASIADDLVREKAEKNIRSLAASLRQELAVNEAQPPARKVTTSTIVVEKGGRFLAMNGSAHMMGELFVELLKRRPELRFVIQTALDGMYKVDMR